MTCIASPKEQKIMPCSASFHGMWSLTRPSQKIASTATLPFANRNPKPLEGVFNLFTQKGIRARLLYGSRLGNAAIVVQFPHDGAE
ncbi:hypothetical protein KCP77_15775 [Salmonella enterica subsp. enterica]|nr:hypothetical protein KCP77_15775 [Salmonella enterica subsp. enterica]